MKTMPGWWQPCSPRSERHETVFSAGVDARSIDTWLTPVTSTLFALSCPPEELTGHNIERYDLAKPEDSYLAICGDVAE
jgi:hypothetical protein